MDATYVPEVDSFCTTADPHPDYDHHQGHGGFQMFFDSSMDTQGLSDELDWLFGTISPEQADVYEPPPDQQENAIPSFSPHSTNSLPSLIDLTSTNEGLWQRVCEKIMSALRDVLPACLGSSFFQPANLEQFYRIYFANYNTHFPILHEASFSCDDASPLLLLAILTLGATLSDHEHFETSELIHDKLRWMIFSVRTVFTCTNPS